MERQRLQSLPHAPSHVVGEQAEQDVGPARVSEVVMDRVHLEVHGLHAAPAVPDGPVAMPAITHKAVAAGLGHGFVAETAHAGTG